MRVIKPGLPLESDWPKTLTCGRCGCVFEIDEEDRRWSGIFPPYAYCPTCTSVCYIEEEKSATNQKEESE
jgi:hypothetical protein